MPKLEKEHLSNFDGVGVYGVRRAADFYDKIEESLLSTARLPVVLFVSGETNSGKTRFWRMVVELLKINTDDPIEVFRVFWADSISTSQKLGLIAKEKGPGEFDAGEGSDASGVFEHSIRHLLVSAKDSDTRRLIIAEAPVHTAIKKKEPESQPENYTQEFFETKTGERVFVKFPPGSVVKDDYNLYLNGIDRAFSVEEDLARRKGLFRKLRYVDYHVGVVAEPKVREADLALRRLRGTIQENEYFMRLLNAPEPEGVARESFRMGANITGTEVIGEQLNNLVFKMKIDGRLDMPLGAVVTPESLRANPKERMEIIRDALIPANFQSMGIRRSRVMIAYNRGKVPPEIFQELSSLPSQNLLESLYGL